MDREGHSRYKGSWEQWALFHRMYDLCGGLRKVCGPIGDIMDRLSISYLETEHSGLDRAEILAVNKYISQFAEPPPMNSQIPGDTRYK